MMDTLNSCRRCMTGPYSSRYSFKRKRRGGSTSTTRNVPSLLVGISMVILFTLLLNVMNMMIEMGQVHGFHSHAVTSRSIRKRYNKEQQVRDPSFSSSNSFQSNKQRRTSKAIVATTSTGVQQLNQSMDERRLPRRSSIFQMPYVNQRENSRIERQSTYHKPFDWVQYRTNKRELLPYILTMPKSMILNNIQKPSISITKLTCIVVVWNVIQLSSNIIPIRLFNKLPLLILPLDQLLLTSPVVGLLLVFRINSCYKRWEEAIINWTKTRNQCRNIMRLSQSMMMKLYSKLQFEDEYDDLMTRRYLATSLHTLATYLWVFARSMKRQLTPIQLDEISYLNDITTKVSNTYHAQQLLKAQHRPNCALQMVSHAIEQLYLLPNICKNEIHNSATVFEQCLGSNERILSSPVPLFYTRFTARFLYLWVALCPFALYTHVIGNIGVISSISKMILLLKRSILLIPMMYVISLFLFGIDEISIQCEEPFSILPQQFYCNEIYKEVMDIAKYIPYPNDDDISNPQQHQQTEQNEQELYAPMHVTFTSSAMNGDDSNTNGIHTDDDITKNHHDHHSAATATATTTSNDDIAFKVNGDHETSTIETKTENPPKMVTTSI